MHGPEGYTATVLCALDIVDRIAHGDHPSGFQTPAGAYGPQLAVDAAGYTIEDLEA
jgi:hypothetical protein